MKKLFLALIISTISFSTLFAERFRIADTKYEITGMTREYALKQDIKINYKRVFESYEELSAYIKDLEQKFVNERVLESAQLAVTYGPETEDDIQLVHLTATTVDSKHFLAVPYPKYDSNDGFILKLKMKDTNFLGTISTLTADVNYSAEYNDEGGTDNKIGINFDYAYPFPAGPFDATWNNDWGVSWTIGQETPEYNLSTGFTFTLPFDGFKVVLDASTALNRDNDYAEYGDTTYYTEEAKLSVPIRLADIDNWGEVNYTPFIDYVFNWDDDGAISKNNEDLSSPTFTVGHGFGSERQNWYGNFRKGFGINVEQSIGYNFQTDQYIPKIEGVLKGYYCFSWIGFCTRIDAFTINNGHKKIGGILRGIKDDQTYKSDTGYGDTKALNVSDAIIFSFDMPIKIVATDWLGWADIIFGEGSSFSEHLRFMRYFDFELQVSPFIDAALTDNIATGRTFSIIDGWYAGGVEVLVYPRKWRSLVVRGSIGADIGRKVVDKVVSSLFDNSWRRQTSAFEVYIGIGLQY